MNQLTPPPERDLSAHRHAQIRRTLIRHLTTTSRPAHPFRTPMLAGGTIVGVAAATIVGFTAWPGGRPADDARRPAPSSPSVAAPSTDSDPHPDDPVAWCHRELDKIGNTPEESPNNADWQQWPLETGPTLRTPDGVIQILIDEKDQWWMACDSTIGRGDHWFFELNLANGSTLPRINERWNYFLSSGNTGTESEPARYFWGAGQMPPGLSSLRFTFPDGHVEDATIKDGFWMVRYQAATDFSYDEEVYAEAGGKTFTVGWRSCYNSAIKGADPPGPKCTP